MKDAHPARSGFTLIELLVVIAIIGLLAAVVLASLGGARNKGIDAAVKSQLNAARAQAELFATSNSNSYVGACAAPSASIGLASITANALSESAKGGAVVTSAVTAGTWQNVTCHDSSSAWALEAPLRASASGAPIMWCVDSNGTAEQASSNIGASVFACP